MASYAVRTDDLGRVIQQMAAQAPSGAAFDYDERLAEALRSRELRHLRWFFYCDNDAGNTIRIYDRVFGENYRHLFKEPKTCVVLRGHGLGTETEAPKREVLQLFEEQEKLPRQVSTNSAERTLQWFAQRNTADAHTTSPAPARVQPQRVGQDADAESERYAALVKQTNLDPAFFARLESLLLRHRQIVLEGPPGAGKTFVAEAFGRWWTTGAAGAATGSGFELIQFHEAYGYEDFVQGIRPVLIEAGQDLRGGAPTGVGYQSVPGVFYTLCERARAHPEARFVLLIDEINRGKASRIFGELLYLLEYRGEDKTVRLASGEMFWVPDNVFLLGTMNTADRSIALVDYALRRRFRFVPLRPFVRTGANPDGDAPVLRRWLGARRITNADGIVRLFCRLNARVAEQSEHLVVGHSHFMPADLPTGQAYPRERLDEIWEYSVLPLLAEYWPHLPSTEIEAQYGLGALLDD
ncbi:MAG: McrB family protein [Chloroflexota bacterium]